MGDAELIAGLRIKIGVEHAARVAELELDAGPLADLQRRIAEAAEELGRIESDQRVGGDQAARRLIRRAIALRVGGRAELRVREKEMDLALKNIELAGKTGTAQNPHGPDHGWFIGFAPATNPRIVVGGIMEFGLHGTTVAPYVSRAIERYLLGPDSSRDQGGPLPFQVPEDSAPRSLPLDSGPVRGLPRPRPIAARIP